MRVHTARVLVITDSGALALMLAILSGVVALVVNSSWHPMHDCGNRYCHHVKRGDEDDDIEWRRP